MTVPDKSALLNAVVGTIENDLDARDAISPLLDDLEATLGQPALRLRKLISSGLKSTWELGGSSDRYYVDLAITMATAEVDSLYSNLTTESARKTMPNRKIRTTVGEIKRLVHEAAAPSSPKVSELWPRFEELITDSEFGSDMSTDEENMPELDEVIADVGLTGDPDLMEKFKAYVFDAAHDYYYSEYASNSPGGRSSHRAGYMKYSRLAKNVLRQMFGQEPHGASERVELEGFISSLDLPVKTPENRYPEYSPEAKKLTQQVARKFGLKDGDAHDAVAAVLSLQDASERNNPYYTEQLDNVAMKLRSLRRRASKISGS